MKTSYYIQGDGCIYYTKATKNNIKVKYSKFSSYVKELHGQLAGSVKDDSNGSLNITINSGPLFRKKEIKFTIDYCDATILYILLRELFADKTFGDLPKRTKQLEK